MTVEADIEGVEENSIANSHDVTFFPINYIMSGVNFLRF